MTTRKTHFIRTEDKTETHSRIKDLDLLVYINHVNPEKTHFLWTEGISQKHSRIKDLDLNNPY